MLVFHGAFDFLPVDAEGRIGKRVVEFLVVEQVVAERVAEFDTADVLPLDQHIAFADGVALGVQFLAKGPHHGRWVQLVNVFHAAGQKPAGPRRGIVDGTDDARLGQGVVVFHEYQRGGQADDVAGREVFASGLVAGLRKSPDEFLEDQSHVVVADRCGAEIGQGDLLDDLVQQVGVLELANELGELKVLEDLAGVGGEAVDVREQVRLDVRTAHLGQVHRGGVVERLLRRLAQKLIAGVGFQSLHRPQLLDLRQNVRFAFLKHALQPPQDREREDDAAVLGLLEITAKEIGK